MGRCRAGVQVCSGDRTWSECTGAVIPAAMETCNDGVDDDCNGMVDDGCNECMGAETRPCYTGPTGTLGQGRCVAGMQTCTSGRWPTTCPGQVLPAAETCGNAIDENCNGMVTDGCRECDPGSTRPCYSGSMATRGVGRCVAGTQVCSPTGTWGTTCLGEVLPAGAENCGNAIDDDCSGMADDGCGECSPGATQSCSSGAAGTTGRGVCRAGTQVCGIDRRFGACTGEVLMSPAA